MALDGHPGGLMKQTGLWCELAALVLAYNCLLNWVFLTGKSCCLLPFLEIIVMVVGKCHHGGCRDGKGGNHLGRYWDSVVS